MPPRINHVVCRQTLTSRHDALREIPPVDANLIHLLDVHGLYELHPQIESRPSLMPLQPQNLAFK
jgi:hypothetical protein